jgi:hypothetical protein
VLASARLYQPKKDFTASPPTSPQQPILEYNSGG